MRRNLFKKTLAFLMTGVLLLSITGCNRGNTANKENQDTSDMMYEGKEIVLEGVDGQIRDFAVKGEKLYFNTRNDDPESEKRAAIYSVNLDGSNLNEIKLCDLGEGENVREWYVAEDNSIIYIIEHFSEDYAFTCTICKQDAEGNELFRKDISKLFETYSIITGILCDAEDRIVIASAETTFILDEKGNLLGNVKLEEGMNTGMAKTKNGEIVFCCDGTEKAFVKVLDTKSQKWGEKYEVDIEYFGGTDCIMSGAEYDFYYKDTDRIYGYDIGKKKSKKLVDFTASGMTNEDTMDIYPFAKDRLMGLSVKQGNSTLMLYEKIDPATLADRKTITFGGTYIDDGLKKAAIDFNRTNKEYKIEFVDYSEEEDPETKLNADILAGKAPDIMDLSYSPVENYAAKGILEDLTLYFEQDADVHTEDILPSVLEAMKIDGKLYYVATCFQIATLVGKTKDVGDKKGWTYDEMKEALEKKGKGTRPFLALSKMDMLYSCMPAFDDLIDLETGECNFDSKEFKEILKLCNEGTNDEEETEDDSSTTTKELRSGKALLMNYWLVDTSEIQICEEMFGKDVSFIGFPSKDREGSYFQFGMQAGISSKSKVKEGAWEFIRMLMTKEFQGTEGNIWMNPTRSDCFEMMMKAKMTTTDYVDELGQNVSPIALTCDMDGEMMEIEPLTKERADIYRELVNRTRKTSIYNAPIVAIIEEEVQPYFAGDKDVDETAKIIQNRVTTYINENK